MTRRTWGFWTEHKLDILGDYLHAFGTAAKNLAQGKTVYLDLYAGAPENESRTTGEPIRGSALRALDTEPALHKLYLFDLAPTAKALDTALHDRYPGRDFEVIPGDSNKTIGAALQAIRSAGLQWAPTFAFLDPYNLGLRWSTLKALADFKRGRRYKVELWILCFTSDMPRVLTTKSRPDDAGAQIVTDFYGSDDWWPIWFARAHDAFTAEEARDEYVNLLRWRLEKALGYKHTHSFAVRTTKGPIYDMVFATDNDTGHKIMGDIYAKAAARQPLMVAEARERERFARDEERGKPRLFALPPVVEPTPAGYIHEPPWVPYGDEDDLLND